MPTRYTRRAFRDPAAGNVEAIVLLAPDDWQVSGGVQWQPLMSRLAQVQTRVLDPVDRIQIDWLPIQDFTFFEVPGGLQAPIGGIYMGQEFRPPITDPAQFVATFWMPGVLSHLQNAQLVNIVQVPAVADEFRRQFGGPADAFAYRLRYAYVQDGQPWEQDVAFALLYSTQNGITSWYVNLAYTVGAPQGVLDADAGIISTIVASRTSTPEWEATYREVQKLFHQGLQQQMADTEAFGRALAQNRVEIAALQQQVAQEREESQDRIADLNGQTLAGVQTYIDPVNRAFVELPLGWNDYWVNDQGEYLTTDQPGFDPNTLNLGTWQRLAPRT